MTTSRVAQIIVRVKGGVRAALEARAVAAGFEAVDDKLEDTTTSAYALFLAYRALERAQKAVARANTRIAATSIPAVGGLTLLAATAIPLATVILPALAVALWQVTAAALVWTTALVGGAAGVGAAVGLMAVSIVSRFNRMRDVIGSAAYHLANELWLLKETFLDVTSGGADRALTGLAAGARALLPLVRSLRDEFTAIGGAVGDMFAALGGAVAGLEPQISAMLTLVPGAVEALGSFAGDLLTLLVQLGTVGMPVLIDGLRTVAGWMRDLTDWFTPARIDEATSTLRAFFDGAASWWKAFSDPIKAVLGPAIDEAGGALGDWAGPLGTIVAALIQIGRILLPPVSVLLAAIAGGLESIDLSGLDVDAIADTIISIGKAGVRWFGDLLAALEPAKPFLLNVLLPLLRGVLDAIGDLPGIIRIVAVALGWLGEQAEPLKPAFEFAGHVLGIVFGGALLRVLGTMVRAIPIIGRIAGPVLTGLGRAWDWVGGRIKWFRERAGTLTGWVGTVARVVTSVVGWLGIVVAFVAGLPARIATAATGLWDGLKTGLVAVVEWIRGKLDWIVAKIEWATSKVGIGGGGRGNPILDALAFGGRGLLGPAGAFLGGLATGGVTPHAGWALVGERGPELVELPGGARVHTSQETRGLLSPSYRPLRPARGGDSGSDGAPWVIEADLGPIVLVTDGRETHHAVERRRINLKARE